MVHPFMRSTKTSTIRSLLTPSSRQSDFGLNQKPKSQRKKRKLYVWWKKRYRDLLFVVHEMRASTWSEISPPDEDKLIVSLRSDAKNSDVLLILVLHMREVISPEFLMSSSEVPNVKTFCFAFSQNLSKRPREGGSM